MSLCYRCQQLLIMLLPLLCSLLQLFPQYLLCCPGPRAPLHDVLRSAPRGLTLLKFEPSGHSRDQPSAAAMLTVGMMISRPRTTAGSTACASSRSATWQAAADRCTRCHFAPARLIVILHQSRPRRQTRTWPSYSLPWLPARSSTVRARVCIEQDQRLHCVNIRGTLCSCKGLFNVHAGCACHDGACVHEQRMPVRQPALGTSVEAAGESGPLITTIGTSELAMIEGSGICAAQHATCMQSRSQTLCAGASGGLGSSCQKEAPTVTCRCPQTFEPAEAASDAAGRSSPIVIVTGPPATAAGCAAALSDSPTTGAACARAVSLAVICHRRALAVPARCMKTACTRLSAADVIGSVGRQSGLEA